MLLSHVNAPSLHSFPVSFFCLPVSFTLPLLLSSQHTPSLKSLCCVHPFFFSISMSRSFILLLYHPLPSLDLSIVEEVLILQEQVRCLQCEARARYGLDCSVLSAWQVLWVWTFEILLTFWNKMWWMFFHHLIFYFILLISRLEMAWRASSYGVIQHEKKVSYLKLSYLHVIHCSSHLHNLQTHFYWRGSERILF